MSLAFTPWVSLDWQRGDQGLVAVTGDRVLRVSLCDGLWLWEMGTYQGKTLEHGTERLIAEAQDAAETAFNNEED